MTKFLTKIKYACVPFMLLFEGILFFLTFNICVAITGSFGPVIRLFLAISLTLLGMFFLRNVPKRTLIISSVIACAIIIVLNLLHIITADVQWVQSVLNIADIFRSTPNNLLLADAFSHTGISMAAGVILTIIECVIPMIYSFSGFWAHIIGSKK